MHRKRIKPQPVYCSGDLKGLEGHKVLRVLADERENISIKLVDDTTGHVVKIRIDNVSLDGRAVTFKEWQGAPHSETIKKIATAYSNTKKKRPHIWHDGKKKAAPYSDTVKKRAAQSTLKIEKGSSK